MSSNISLEQFLAPISKALGHDEVPDRIEPCGALSALPTRVHANEQTELTNTFCAAAEAMHVTVRRCTQENVAREVAGIIAEGNGSTGADLRAVVPNDKRIEHLGISDAVVNAGAECDVWDSAKSAQANRQLCLEASFGITFPVLAVAETGSVVQLCDAECGRSISLLPDTHIAIIDAKMIRPQMSDALAELAEVGGENGCDLPSQICFISGPSNTSDIELVRVEGVHGPIYVHYVVIEA